MGLELRKESFAARDPNEEARGVGVLGCDALYDRTWDFDERDRSSYFLQEKVVPNETAARSHHQESKAAEIVHSEAATIDFAVKRSLLPGYVDHGERDTVAHTPGHCRAEDQNTGPEHWAELDTW